MIVKVSKTNRPPRDPCPANDLDGIEYDNLGRMKFHPDFHDCHGQRFSEEELCYLAKFYKFDGRRKTSLALGRPEASIQKKYLELLHTNQLNHYKQMDHYC